jgi:hypothetical protein
MVLLEASGLEWRPLLASWTATRDAAVFTPAVTSALASLFSLCLEQVLAQRDDGGEARMPAVALVQGALRLLDMWLPAALLSGARVAEVVVEEGRRRRQELEQAAAIEAAISGRRAAEENQRAIVAAQMALAVGLRPKATGDADVVAATSSSSGASGGSGPSTGSDSAASQTDTDPLLREPDALRGGVTVAVVCAVFTYAMAWSVGAVSAVSARRRVEHVLRTGVAQVAAEVATLVPQTVPPTTVALHDLLLDISTLAWVPWVPMHVLRPWDFEEAAPAAAPAPATAPGPEAAPASGDGGSGSLLSSAAGGPPPAAAPAAPAKVASRAAPVQPSAALLPGHSASLFVPTPALTATLQLSQQLLLAGQHVLLTGPPCVGKSLATSWLFRTLRGLTILPTASSSSGMPRRVATVAIPFATNSSSRSVLGVLESGLERRRRGVFAPSGDSVLVVTVDDVSAPLPDAASGSQPAVELLRQVCVCARAPGAPLVRPYPRRVVCMGPLRHKVAVTHCDC